MACAIDEVFLHLTANFPADTFGLDFPSYSKLFWGVASPVSTLLNYKTVE